MLAWFIETEKKESNLDPPLPVLPLDQFARFASHEGLDPSFISQLVLLS